MKPSVGWCLPDRPRVSDNLYNLKMQVYHNGRQSKFSVNIFLTEEEFKSIMSNSAPRKNRLRILKEEMDKVFMRANNIIQNMKPFDYENFKSQLFGEIKRYTTKYTLNLGSGFDDLIELHKKTEKEYDTYTNAKKAFIIYFSRYTSLNNISSEKLIEFRNWYIKERGSLSTANTYLRCLKRVYKYHIEKGTITAGTYPFVGVKIQNATKRKQAYRNNDIKKIFEYIPLNSAQAKAKDYWIFCYLANGMNPTDMFRLKWTDIQDGVIVFYRKKTINTDRNPQPIQVEIFPELQEIIDRQCEKPIKPNNYIFPVLNRSKGRTPSTDEQLIRSYKKQINRILHRIGEKLELVYKLNLGIARSTFATKTVLGGHRDKLQEMMGHESPNTTEHYIASLPVARFAGVHKVLLDYDEVD